jgi:hypothetical protein
MIVATVVVTFAAMYSTGAPRPTEPGMIAYTPTRVEWLALQLEADYRDENFENVGQYSIGFAPKFPNTIMILVNYTGAASAANVDTAIDVARILVKKEASNYGWSDWVKVEVQRKVLPTNH